MRIVTWNINGLRAVLKRGFGDIKSLLDFLEADIICFQETKLAKAELDRDLALVEGWDSYFSHCKDRSYSGVATYCRKSASIPVAAEQGITGLLHQKETSKDTVLQDIPNCYDELCSRFTQDELLAIDLEGRCVITDHGQFILFNLYGPAITNEESAEERFAYKLRLYKALQLRIEACLAANRAVILLGDLNICPQPIDSCDPGDLGKFLDRADKKWLSSVMQHSGGYFVDLFRHFHPVRKEVYSCWSTASGARVNNYGARIDLILQADPQNYNRPQSDQNQPVLGSAASHTASLLQQCTASDVWMEAQGSDHAPVWADFELLQPLPTPETAPLLSSRHFFTGTQRKLTSWFGGQAKPSEPSSDTNATQGEKQAQHVNRARSGNLVASQPRLTLLTEQQATAESIQQAVQASSSTANKGSSMFLSDRPSSSARAGSQSARASQPLARAGQQPARAGQKSLKAFFQAPAAKASSGAVTDSPASTSAPVLSACDTSTIATNLPLGHSQRQTAAQPESPFKGLASKPVTTAYAGAAAASHQSAAGAASDTDCTQAAGSMPSQQDAALPLPQSSSAVSASQGIPDIDKAAATEAWQRIHTKMKAPRCKGHSEDCVIREVKKNGPNKGRLFYVCRRPDGKPPQGRCDHFEWVGNRTTRGEPVSTQPSALKRLRKA